MDSRFRKKGIVLIEMIVYIVILAFVLTVIVNVLTVITQTQRSLKASRTVEASAAAIMETVGREIRQSISIDLGQSALGVHPGTITLHSRDVDGNPRTVAFSVADDTVYMSENGANIGPLTHEDTKVTNFLLRSITTPNSTGVKLELQLEVGTSSSYRNENFYSTFLLRGSY